MNKTVNVYRKDFRIFGIKFAEIDEKYEQVYLEDVEPISSLIVTEYEIEKMNNLGNE